MNRTMHTRWASLIVLLTLLAALLVSSGWAADQEPQGVEEKAPDLIILYTGNVYGHIEPCG